VRVSGDRIIGMLQALVAQQAADLDATRPAIVIGLIGRGIQSSRSPVMHEREGARLGMRYSYVLVDFDRLELGDDALGTVVEALERLGFAGFNVTHPFKQSIIPHLTALAPEAAAIGAVNTVVLKDGGRTGHNTDCWGFAESFRDTMTACPLDRVVQFGAGGAGAAVSYALMELGVADLTIIDSDRERAERLCERMAARFGQQVHASADVGHSLSQAAGVVNTTPVGMVKYPGMPFPAGLLCVRHWVAEIIYFPQETELLRRARALGCRTLAGTGMAVYQAVRAFELFTGVAPDRAAMISHFEAAA